MTLYELLHKVSFDELIPTLEGVYDVKDIYSYREAFDELMLNEAAGQTDGVIELSRDEDDTPSFMERPDNKYRRKWSEVHSRQQVMYARGRKEKRECFREAMSWDICKRIRERKERRNRAKRMRDARMDRVSHGVSRCNTMSTNSPSM